MKIFRRKEGGLIVFLPFRSGRPRVGGDQGHAVGLAAGLIISTHAPAWGRPVNPLDVNCAEYFYSRPHVGGDAFRLPLTLSTLYFYSRPHVGGDDVYQMKIDEMKEFLLTPPCGGQSSCNGMD